MNPSGEPMATSREEAEQRIRAYLQRTDRRGPARVVAAHRRWAHRLSYGRHAGPAAWNHRSAAVMVILSRGEHGWFIPLIVRPTTMRAHAGQVAFPGGSRHVDETAYECAVRETREELGVEPNCYRVLGPLSPISIYVSNFLVEPWLAVAESGLALDPNPAEVAEVLEFPAAQLTDPSCYGEHRIERFGVDFQTPHLGYQNWRIWGATCSILGELRDLLDEVDWPRS